MTRQLEIWEEVGYQVWEDEDKTVPKAPYKAKMDDRVSRSLMKAWMSALFFDVNILA